MAQNVSQRARTAQWTTEDAAVGAEAMKMALDPMLRDIEAQSGMVRGANVLPNQLFTDSGRASAMTAYYQALASKLPEYVNARRAFEEDAKKKAAAAGGGGGGMAMPQMYQMPMQSLLPPQYYLPMTNVGVRGRTGPEYVTSPYGAIPQQVVAPTQPASRVLAQRRYSRSRMTEM